MRSIRTLAAAALVLGVSTGCSSSTKPAPSLTGRRNVSVGTLIAGSIIPASFTVTVSQQGNSYAGTTPDTVWWSGVRFDTLPDVKVHGDTLFGSLNAESNFDTQCALLGFEAVFNAARDTARGQVVVVPSHGNLQPMTCTSSGPVTVTR